MTVTIERGYCECGCGEKTRLAPKTNNARGWNKGEPLRFIAGHSGRLRPSGVVKFVVDSGTGCWVWQRSIISSGYGHLTINNKQHLAHRFLYEQFYGLIPKGLTLDHLCSNKRCVNPKHLEAVPHAENCRRGRKSKLDWQAVDEIRKATKEGVSRKVLAARFYVDISTIRAVVNNRAWTQGEEVWARTVG